MENIHSHLVNKVEVKCGGGPHWQEGSLTDIRYNEDGT